MRVFTTQVRVGVLCAVIAAACVVAACGASPVVVKPTTTATSSSAPAQLFADDFQGACQGATVSRATPYAEAGTSKVLGTTELDGTDDTCPMFMSFDDENQKKTYDAPPSKEDVVAFVKPFVQP
jgi:hypothetical protein